MPNPCGPCADPILWRELSWYGAHMAYKEEEAGLSGVINGAIYSGWGHFGFHWITPVPQHRRHAHRIGQRAAGVAAVHASRPVARQHAQPAGLSKPRRSSRIPWPGGWWHLRDIVERQKISAWATLDLAARNRETVLWNAYLKGKRQTERGAAGKPGAYLISALQHDPLTADQDDQQAARPGHRGAARHQGVHHRERHGYPEGSFVVSMAQPKMGLIRYLLGRTFYPDNEWTRDRDGSPIRPYDMATDTMFEFMGVRVDPLDDIAEIHAVSLQKVTAPITPAGKVTRGTNGYSIDGRLNDSFRAVNLLFDKTLPCGAWTSLRRDCGLAISWCPPGSEATLEDSRAPDRCGFHSTARCGFGGVHETKRLRVAMYQRFGGGNIDEGWTPAYAGAVQFPVHLDLRSGDQKRRPEREVRRPDHSQRFHSHHHR